MALLGNLTGQTNSPYAQASTSLFSTPLPLGPLTSSTSRIRIRMPDDTNSPSPFSPFYDTQLVKCDRCEQSKPDSWKCLNCHIFLCLSCTIEHQNGLLTKDHQIAYCPMRRHNNSGSLSSSSRESGSPPLLSNHYCDTHREPHKLYCEKCIKTYCSSCGIVPNRCHHKLIHVNEAIVKAKRTNSYFDSEVESIIREIKDGIQKVELNRIHNEHACSLVQCDITENFRRVQERVANLLRDVTNEKKEKEKNIEIHRGRLEMLMSKMTNTSQALKESLNSENPWDVIMAKERASREISLFKQREMNILTIDESEITFIPPKDDLFRRVTVPDYRILMEPKSRPVYGVNKPVVVKRLEGINDVLVIGDGPGEAPGKLCRPWGVCCNNFGQIIVADRSNNRIQVFDSEGRFLGTFGKAGAGIGEFNKLAGVTVNPSGQIVVADKDNHRIQIFTIEGDFVRAFGRQGSYPGQFNYPWDVACNSKGQIAVTDTRNHRVQLFEEDGTFVRCYESRKPKEHRPEFKDIDTPRGVCFTPTGEVIVTDFNIHKLLKLDAIFRKNPRYIGGQEAGQGAWQFNRPQGVVCDDKGNLIIADSKNHRIQVLDCMGNFLWSVGYQGSGRGELNTPSGICLTPEGRIVVVDFANNRVQVF